MKLRQNQIEIIMISKTGLAYPALAMAALLTAAAGFADAVGYLRGGIFAANMTGNTVLAGLSLAEHQWSQAGERGITLVTFFVGAMLGRVLLRLARGRSWVPLSVEALVIAVMAFDSDTFTTIWGIALAMGIQASAILRFSGVATSTVVITSTMARIAEALTDRLWPGPGEHAPPVAGATLLIVTWIFYGIGALIAGLFMRDLAYPLLVPAGMVALVAALSFRTSP